MKITVYLTWNICKIPLALWAAVCMINCRYQINNSEWPWAPLKSKKSLRKLNASCKFTYVSRLSLSKNPCIKCPVMYLCLSEPVVIDLYSYLMIIQIYRVRGRFSEWLLTQLENTNLRTNISLSDTRKVKPTRYFFGPVFVIVFRKLPHSCQLWSVFQLDFYVLLLYSNYNVLLSNWLEVHDSFPKFDMHANISKKKPYATGQLFELQINV